MLGGHVLDAVPLPRIPAITRRMMDIPLLGADTESHEGHRSGMSIDSTCLY
jgi:hypothetical protein